MASKNPTSVVPHATFHDDWLLWIVYTDGSVRQFETELWPEHGTRTHNNWVAVTEAALADKTRGHLLRFALEYVPQDGGEISESEFFELLNAWSSTLADSDRGYAR